MTKLKEETHAIIFNDSYIKDGTKVFILVVGKEVSKVLFISGYTYKICEVANSNIYEEFRHNSKIGGLL